MPKNDFMPFFTIFYRPLRQNHFCLVEVYKFSRLNQIQTFPNSHSMSYPNQKCVIFVEHFAWLWVNQSISKAIEESNPAIGIALMSTDCENNRGSKGSIATLNKDHLKYPSS